MISCLDYYQSFNIKKIPLPNLIRNGTWCCGGEGGQADVGGAVTLPPGVDETTTAPATTDNTTMTTTIGIIRHYIKQNKVWGQIFVYFQLSPIQATVNKKLSPNFI